MKIPELLQSLKIPFRRHGESPLVTDGWVGLECFWCGRGTGKYGLGIHLQSGRASCWKCGSRNIAEILVTYADISFKQAKELLGGVDIRRLPAHAEPRGKLVLPTGLTDLLPAHRRYLERRGFDPDELIQTWGLRGLGIHPNLPWRIFIPVQQGNETVSWTTRAIGNVPHNDRYRGAKRDEEAVHRRDVLYGEQHARHGIVVHEGPFDVFRTGPGAVCTAGIGFSRGQIVRLARYPIRAICFDNEPGAQKRARFLADQLAPFPGTTDIVCLSGPDPAESPADEIAELRSRYLT